MNQGFPGQWAKHIDAVWGAQQRRTAGGPHGPGGGPAGGPPPWLAGLFGMGQGPEAKPRARRGDVRSAILDVVRAAAERGEPVNGYQVIQQIAERSEEAWRPSPGSVYPTISQLEDEGLLVTDETLGRKSLRLTAAGEAYVAEHAAELAAVWTPFRRTQPGAGGEHEAAADGSGASWRDLKPEIGQMMSAVWQIVTSGSEAQKTAAAAVLVETRRKLYGILADGEHPTADPDGPADGRTADQIAGEQAEGPR